MRRSRALIAGAAVIAAGVAVGVISLPASAQTATFALVNSWNTGYQAEVTVANDTSSTISNWQVKLTLPAGTTIVDAWNSTKAASGSTYTFTPAPWNGKLSPGVSTSFGFVANGTGRPTSCVVNGRACGGGTASARTSSSAGRTSPAAPGRTTTSPAAPKPTATTPAPEAPAAGGTPLAVNGQLHVCGVHLCNRFDKAIQLRGMSTHGLQFAPNCYNDASLDALAGDWHADLLRIAMYVQEGGFETDPAGFTAKVNSLVDKAEARGMYAIIDFHILNPGDPNFNLDRAKSFFASVSKRNAAKKNVLYEIANEPNGVSWADIKSYAEKVIPVIRANDPDAVVIVGTRGWSSLGVSEGSNSSEIVDDPVKASNIMYTFHFYAASHKDNYRAEVEKAAARIPLFVTEFGTVTFTGGGTVDEASSTTWLNLLDSLKISYANWTFSDINESSAALKPGTCSGKTFAGTGVLTQSGAFMRARIRTPDSFPSS
jgi:endoglucanase